MRINTDDGQLRRPQSWGALHALESLTPPSPSPSGSLGALAALASLSDIPIFLHTDDDSSPRDLNSTAANPGRRQSAFLVPSASTTTVHSTNTFGVPSSPSTCPGEPEVIAPDNASDCTAKPAPRRNLTPNPAYLSAVRPSRSGGYFSNRFASISDLSHFTISAYMEPWASGDNLTLSPSSEVDSMLDVSPVASPSGSIIVSPADDYDSTSVSPSPFYETSQFPSTDSLASGPSPSLAPLPSRSWSAISSVLFSRLNISPSPSLNSTQTSDGHPSPSPGKHRFGLSLKKTRSPSVHSDLGEQTKRRPSPLGNGPSRSTPVSPISPQFDALPAPLLAPGRTESSAVTSSGPSSASGYASRAPPSTYDLPAALSWLGGTCIELWVDQEGFRAIRPRFRLAHYTAPPPGTPTADVLTHGVAAFRPLRCHSAVYHHGALDSAPVLRRLTMAGNEERDYISRHASLTIKENGVYAVSGTEWVEDHHSHGHGGPHQLSWRFEYAVDDLRTHGGRRAAANGEKTLVPLSFSCSPVLLEHGKRIKLMHVLKKNITPKLSAKAVIDSPVREKTHIAALRAGSTRKTRSSPSHRRTRSTEPPASDPASWHPTSEDEPTKKARPVSVSAAPSPSELGELPYEAGAHPETTVGSITSSRLSAHILTQEELADILFRFPGPVDRPPVAQSSGLGR